MQEVDEFRPRVEPDNVGCLVMLQENALLDELRRHVDQRHGMRLTGASVTRVHGRRIENCQQRA